MSTFPSTSASAGMPPGRKTFAPFRLRRHADYGRVYKASRKHFSPSMTYFFRVRGAGEEPAQGPRIGLTVGRVMGKAVDRNRIKRRMREAARLHLYLLSSPAPACSPAIDLVLHPRKAVASMDFQALERELGKVFTQVANLSLHPQALRDAIANPGPARRHSPSRNTGGSSVIPSGLPSPPHELPSQGSSPPHSAGSPSGSSQRRRQPPRAAEVDGTGSRRRGAKIQS